MMKPLTDARGVVSIDIGQNYIWDMVPSSRPLHMILADAVQHGVDHPTHGYNCACQDNLIREIRTQIYRATPDSEWLRSDDSAWSDRMDALLRMRHILGCVIRGL